MAKKKITKKQESGDSKTLALITVLLSVVGTVIAILAWKKDKYVMHYAKEALVLFITAIVLSVASALFGIITLGLGLLITPLISLFLLVLWVIQIINSLSGEERPTPLIGQFAKKIDF